MVWEGKCVFITIVVVVVTTCYSILIFSNGYVFVGATTQDGATDFDARRHSINKTGYRCGCTCNSGGRWSR